MPTSLYPNRLHGIVLLDKPAGISSNQALQQAKRLLGVRKAGHTGSLDPLATGLLPICLGEATKIAGILLGARKAYEATITLGVQTDTDDAAGQVIDQRPVPTLDRPALAERCQQFVGTYAQQAPIYSAIKQQGQPLYQRARRGETVQAPCRLVTIESLTIVDWQSPHLHMHVRCGPGTYIRSLARDLGRAIGCGGCLTALRRLWVEPFVNPHMIRLPDLAEAVRCGTQGVHILPLAAGLNALPAVHLSPANVQRFRTGQMVFEVNAPTGLVAVFALSTAQPIGLGEVVADATLVARRGFQSLSG